MQRQQSDCQGTRWAKIQLAQKALAYSTWNNHILMEIFLLASREGIDPLLVQRADNTKKISTLLQKIREQVESGEEAELLDAVDTTRWPYDNSYEQALHLLIDERKLVEARAAMVKVTLPLLLNYHNAWNAFVQFQCAEGESTEGSEGPEQKVADQTQELARANHELANEITEHKHTKERLSELISVVESSGDAIIGTTLDGTILRWNRGAERIYGYSASEVIGRPITILMPNEYLGMIGGIFERLKGGEEIQAYETVRLRKDGQQIVVSMTISPLKDENGTIVGTSAIARDVTERKMAEERFYKAFNASPEPITIATMSDGRYIDVNESFARVTGYQREEVIGRTSLEIKFWGRPEDRATLIEILTKQGSVRNLEITFLTKSGEERTGLDSAEIIEIAGQKCILAILKDITEQKILEKQRKRAEEALAQRARELARSNAELEQFAYVASHDLQEPLRMVASFTQLLAKRYNDKLDADGRDFIAYAVDGATRMQTLIADLLNYSRVGTRGKPFQSVNCDAILERVLVVLKPAIKESGAVVRHDPLPTVSGDEMQLEQLFQNLLANAIKFHSETPPLIHVSAEHIGKEWNFSVRDNGIGIAPEYTERIFMIFQRLHTKAEYPGSGIGLAICKKIVERHGGRIWVNSESGTGTSFFFTIPDSGTAAPEEQG
jgi:PAS domain S-box-containing protein